MPGEGVGSPEAPTRAHLRERWAYRTFRSRVQDLVRSGAVESARAILPC
jgi:hypothetical protein